jgi:hypothetical protein
VLTAKELDRVERTLGQGFFPLDSLAPAGRGLGAHPAEPLGEAGWEGEGPLKGVYFQKVW